MKPESNRCIYTSSTQPGPYPDTHIGGKSIQRQRQKAGVWQTDFKMAA